MHHGLFLFHDCSSKFSWQLPAPLADWCFTSALLLLEPVLCCAGQGTARCAWEAWDWALPVSLGSPHETSSKNCSRTMGELNQSHVNYAADLQKCLHTRLVLVSVYLFSRFFLIATLKKLPPKVVRWKQIIKIIGTALLFLPSCHSPRVYSNGTGNWSKILVAMFSSSCLKPMDVVKVLQNTSNPAHLHCDVCQGFGACSACLWESSRKEILLGA